MIMTDKAKPTITLAELYENQNQYIDALVIYKNLYKENPTEKSQNKIDGLKDKIFNDKTLKYSTIIDKIFTEEEKKTFHILPHEQFKAYTESQAEMKNEETYPENLTEIKEEDVIDSKETEQAENVEEKLGTDMEHQNKNQILEILTSLSNLKPEIVEKVLKENVGSDTSISGIKLSDLNFVVELLKAPENVKKN
jgi:hypothetical protein